MNQVNLSPIADDERGSLPSASGIERLINCPGSPAAQRDLPPLPEQAVTSQGTDIHTAMETGDATGMEEDEQEIAVRLERLELRAVEDWSNKHEFTLHERDAQMRRHAEERLWIRDRQSLELVASAKLDVYYVARVNALIIDFKSGFKKATPSDRNWQLITQAIALHHERPDIESFTIGIAADRLKSTLDIAHYTAAALRHAESVLMTSVWRSQQPNAARVPGTWCQYCRAIGECSVAAAWSQIALQNPALQAGGIGMLQAVQNMTPEQMKFVWQRSAAAKGIMDAVKLRLERVPADQLAAIGLQLKPGAEVRKITDVSLARQKLSLILSPEEIDACSTLAIGKLESAAKKGTLTKANAAKLVESTLDGVIEKKQNKSSLEEI